MAVALFPVTSLITVTPCAFLAHFLQVYQRCGQDFPRSLAPVLCCHDSSGLCAFALMPRSKRPFSPQCLGRKERPEAVCDLRQEGSRISCLSTGGECSCLSSHREESAEVNTHTKPACLGLDHLPVTRTDTQHPRGLGNGPR